MGLVFFSVENINNNNKRGFKNQWVVFQDPFFLISEYKRKKMTILSPIDLKQTASV